MLSLNNKWRCPKCGREPLYFDVYANCWHCECGWGYHLSTVFREYEESLMTPDELMEKRRKEDAEFWEELENKPNKTKEDQFSLWLHHLTHGKLEPFPW